MKEKKIPSIGKQAIWNTSAGILSALESVIMIIAIKRVINLEAAGEVTVAFAFGNLFRTIGLWGVRNYQVSDQKKEYSFCDYLVIRYVSIFFMFIAVFHFLLYAIFVRDFSVQKIFVISIVALSFFIECFEDVIWGEYHRRGRLDIGAKLFLSRWGSLLISFVLAIIISKNLCISLLISLIISLVIFSFMLIFIYGLPDTKRELKEFSFFSLKRWRLLKNTAPLFAVAFLTFFLCNVAKYSIDYYYDDKMQAIFGFITLPMFAIDIFSTFIYNPKLTNISNLWLYGDKKKFIFEILKQILYIFLITVACVFFLWLIGITILSIIFDTDLTPFRIDIFLNIIGGGFLALLIFGCALLTVMRKQKLQFIIYSISSLIGCCLIWIGVRFLGIRGGTICNLIVFSLQSIAIYFAIISILVKRKEYKI